MAVAMLSQTFALSTIIDFRTTEEASSKDAHCHGAIFKIFTVTVTESSGIASFVSSTLHQVQKRVTESLRINTASLDIPVNPEANALKRMCWQGERGGGGTIFRLPLALHSHYIATIMVNATMVQLSKLAYYGLRSKLGNKNQREHYKLQAKYIGMDILNKLGLFTVNKMILKKNGPAIFQFMLMCSVPSNYPILLHCSHGKDRTGLYVYAVFLLSCSSKG